MSGILHGRQAMTPRILATGLQFPEGPVALADGSIACVEIAGGRVSRWRPDGTVELIARTGGGPNGLAIGADGAFYVCDNGGNLYRPGEIGSIGVPADFIFWTTGLSRSALSGRWMGSFWSEGFSSFICSQMELPSVMPLPFKSMLKAVMMCAFVPKPMVAAMG
jgi:hypothetical protein